MPQSHCFGCQQVFGNKKNLFSHLQQNPSHKRGKTSIKTTASRRQLQSQGKKNDKTGDHAPAIMVEAGSHAANVAQRSHSEMEWLRVSREQDAFIREIIPGQCHPQETLRICQYHLENRTQEQLEQLQACLNCNRKRTDLKFVTEICVFHADRRKGKRKFQARTCCTSQSQGCRTSLEHLYRPIIQDDFRASPERLAILNNTQDGSKRDAVVVDCEMVGVKGGSSELAQLCVVDLFTAEVLLNSLVQPNGNVTDWRTKYSGIAPSRMEAAIRDGHALQGWEAAQEELWKHIDADTIVVGHALQHDLKALHLIHHRVIDTSVLTRLAVSPDCKRSWGLKVLCAELADLVVQNHGSRGHDCLEDTLATREVFLRCLLEPELFRKWADQKRIEELAKALARETARSLRVRKATRQDRPRAMPQDEDDTDEEDYEDSEILHWSDIAEELGWPHPDTGYDPWSD